MKNIREIICDKCHKLVPVSDVRYCTKDKNTVSALCSICRTPKGIEKNINKDKTAVPQKVVYLCQTCNYKFGFNSKSTAIPKCPYCGRMSQLIKCEGLSTLNTLIKRSKFEF